MRISSILVQNYDEYVLYGTTVHCEHRLGSVVRFVVVVKPQSPRFDPGLANYVYRTLLAITLALDAKINTSKYIVNPSH